MKAERRYVGWVANGTPSCFNPEKETLYQMYRRLGGPPTDRNNIAFFGVRILQILPLNVSYRLRLCKKRGVPVGPHVFYMFYMNILYVIGCENIHTVLLKLYNQFYMNIMYEIVCKNVHFYEEEYMDPTCVFNFFTFFERILCKSNCVIFIFS